MTDYKVLERNVFHAGKILVKQGEDKSESYIIQEGEVVTYTMRDGKRIEIERLGPGCIIGEINLISDEKSAVTYEALINTTVVKITRQDFEKK